MTRRGSGEPRPPQRFYLLRFCQVRLKKGQKALVTIVLTTALVLTPLILGGALLGLYLGGPVGYSGSVLAILFSTVGFVVGMFVIFRVIRAVVARTDGPSR